MILKNHLPPSPPHEVQLTTEAASGAYDALSDALQLAGGGDPR
ncbi:MAG TPA: hypothetical protein VG293_07195 [Solirubrobacteraceae bacterium]|jgi:hypothetical protein|nr:hypothetical protein [Solirubrobacteraceae bacterium]